MSQSGGDEVIRMVVQLDDAEMERAAKDAQDKLNAQLGNAGKSAKAAPAGSSPTSPPTPPPAGANSQQAAQSFSQILSKSLTQQLQGFASRVMPPGLQQVGTAIFGGGRAGAGGGGAGAGGAGGVRPPPIPGGGGGWMGTLRGWIGGLGGGGAGGAGGGGAAAGAGGAGAAGMGGLAAGGIAALVALKLNDLKRQLGESIQGIKTFGKALLSGDGAEGIKAFGHAINSVTPFTGVLGKAFNKLVDVVEGMLQAFAKYNPRLMAEQRMFERTVMLYRREVAQRLQPALSEWIRFKLQFLALLRDLGPVVSFIGANLKTFAAVLRGMVTAIGGIVKVISLMGASLARAFQKIFEVLDKITPGSLFKNAAEGAGRLADDLTPGQRKGLAQQAQEWNQSFVTSLRGSPFSTIGRVNLPPGRGGFATHQPAPGPVNGPTTGAANAAIAVPAAPSMPTPDLSSLSVKVQNTFNTNLSYEEAVRRTIDQVRAVLMGAMGQIRDEAALVADLVGGHARVWADNF